MMKLPCHLHIGLLRPICKRRRDCMITVSFVCRAAHVATLLVQIWKVTVQLMKESAAEPLHASAAVDWAVMLTLQLAVCEKAAAFECAAGGKSDGECFLRLPTQPHIDEVQYGQFPFRGSRESLDFEAITMIERAHVQFLAMLAQSSEFENMAVREEELPELDNLVRSVCPFEVKGGPENKHGKINILLQVSRLLVTPFPFPLPCEWWLCLSLFILLLVCFPSLAPCC